MSQQAKTGNVGQRVDGQAVERLGSCTVERGHDIDDLCRRFFSEQSFLQRSGHNARPERLSQHEHIARLRAGVSQHALRRHNASDDETIFWLGIVDGVPADDLDTGFAGHGSAALHDPAQHFNRQLARRKTDDVEREQRPAAHRVHITERIGCGDAAEIKRIVDDRRDKVDGLNDDSIVVEPICRRIIGGRGADQDRRIFDWGQLAQHLCQVLGTNLARSAAAARQLRQCDLFGHDVSHQKNIR